MKKLGTWLAAFVAGAIALQAPVVLAQEGHASREPADHGHEYATGVEDSDPEHATAIESSNIGQHDYDRDHDQGTEVTGPARFIQWLGKFHPIVVHFPIALLVAAAVAELLHMATDKQMFVAAAQFSVWFGAIAAVVAAVLGWCFGGFQLVDEDWVITTHRWMGSATGAWAILVVVLNAVSSPQQRRSYLIALFVGAAMVGVTGFFGGALIHGLDHLSW